MISVFSEEGSLNLISVFLKYDVIIITIINKKISVENFNINILIFNSCK
jgi:hypothetical protein